MKYFFICAKIALPASFFLAVLSTALYIYEPHTTRDLEQLRLSIAGCAILLFIVSLYLFSISYLFPLNTKTSYLSRHIQDQIKYFSEQRVADNEFVIMDRLIYQTLLGLCEGMDESYRTCKFNLIWGVSFALIGLFYILTLIALSYLGLSATFINAVQADSLIKLLVFFAPNFTAIIIIETVSLFFLRNYNNDRENIKYLRNEITNIELKHVGLKSSALTKNKELVGKLAYLFASTERNFVLKKGEDSVTSKIATSQQMFLDHVLSTIGSIGRYKYNEKENK